MAAAGENVSENTNVTGQSEDNLAEKKRNTLAGTLFLGGIAAISLSAGFGYTVGLAKKQDPAHFTKGLFGSKAIPESGGALAMRALGIGTLYAVSGVGLLSFAVWKLMGVHSMEEFSAKMRSATPNPTKNKEQGRTDFKTVQEVVDYIISEDEKKHSKNSDS